MVEGKAGFFWGVVWEQKAAQESVDRLRDAGCDLEDQVARLEKKNKKLETQVEGLQEEVGTLDKDLDKAFAELKALRQQLRGEEAAVAVEELLVQQPEGVAALADRDGLEDARVAQLPKREGRAYGGARGRAEVSGGGCYQGCGCSAWRGAAGCGLEGGGICGGVSPARE